MRQPIESGSGPREAERQFLTFTLGLRSDANSHATDYGIDLLDIQEIRGYTQATPIPNAPAHIKGAINLRGSVIPVFDLRLRFGVTELGCTKFTVIIVAHVGGKTMGLIADSVSDVLTLKPSDLLPPPDFGVKSAGDCVDGIANVGGNLVLILNVARMLAPDGILEPMAAEAGNLSRDAA